MHRISVPFPPESRFHRRLSRKRIVSFALDKPDDGVADKDRKLKLSDPGQTSKLCAIYYLTTIQLGPGRVQVVIETVYRSSGRLLKAVNTTGLAEKHTHIHRVC
jgi:hypothetical protein